MADEADDGLVGATTTRRAASGAEAISPLAVLPLFFRLRGRRIVMAGGGDPVAWKAELLAASGAAVAVFAPEPSAKLAALARRMDGVSLHARALTPGDFAGAVLAIADGADLDAATAFAAAARSAGLPVNVIDRPALCDFSFGAIVNRSPLVVGLATDGAAPVFAQALRARLEALLPANLAAWAAAARDWRARLAGLDFDFRRRRGFWERFAARALDRDAPPAEADFEALAADVESLAAAPSRGEIVLVGAGPGDPDLLTMKAVRALQRADVVLYDDLVGAGVLELARREAERLSVGKRGYAPSMPQEETTALLVRLARKGKVVVRLKGGDPSVFGRANEEIGAARAAGLRVTVIPGVTTALAGAAELGVSLSDKDRARRIQFVTAHGPDGALPDNFAWSALADPDATTVVYMGVRTLPGLIRRMLVAGLDPKTRAALLANVSRPDASRLFAPVSEMPAAVAAHPPAGPCILIVGRTLEQLEAAEAQA